MSIANPLICPFSLATWLRHSSSHNASAFFPIRPLPYSPQICYSPLPWNQGPTTILYQTRTSLTAGPPPQVRPPSETDSTTTPSALTHACRSISLPFRSPLLHPPTPLTASTTTPDSNLNHLTDGRTPHQPNQTRNAPSSTVESHWPKPIAYHFIETTAASLSRSLITTTTYIATFLSKPELLVPIHSTWSPPFYFAWNPTAWPHISTISTTCQIPLPSLGSHPPPIATLPSPP